VILASVCVVISISIVLAVRWAASGTMLRSAPVASRRLQAVDLAAFRNLVSREEDAYLRRYLPSSAYLRVRRARLLATRAYLAAIAENCATIMLLLQAGETEELSPQAQELAHAAVMVRITVMGMLGIVYLEYAMPRLEIRPAAALNAYRELVERVLSYVRARDYTRHSELVQALTV
jgi:hypothetical protein